MKVSMQWQQNKKKKVKNKEQQTTFIITYIHIITSKCCIRIFYTLVHAFIRQSKEKLKKKKQIKKKA